jgi:hypothetical protein
LLCTVLFATQAALPAFALPSYAVQGAFASYTAEGGFIAYFSGVEGNLTYTVTRVFGNGSMGLSIFENITAGEDLNPFITTLNITDSVQNPRNFPAVSLDNLSTLHVIFQNVSATFSQNATVSVPAGTFDTLKFVGYQGTGANRTSVNFWFDRETGLMIQESSGASVMELDSTNIAIPIGPPSLLNAEIPYELVFVLAFAVGGTLFWYLRYHYTRDAQKRAASMRPAK